MNQQSQQTSEGPATSKIVYLPDCRLSFPNLYSPRAGLQKDDGTPGDPSYGCHLIIEPNSQAAAAIKAAALEVAQAKWGANAANIIGAMEKSKKCIRVGNLMLKRDGTIREGYQGMLYVVARAPVKRKPRVLADKFHNGKPLHVHEDGSVWQRDEKSNEWKQIPVQFKVTPPYGGCYVNAQVEVYAYEGTGAKARQGKSLNASILIVQFLRDGKAFEIERGNEDDFSEVGGPAQSANTGMGAADPFAADPFGGEGQAPQSQPQGDPFA